ncbi:hypothetical protein MP228_011756 [Amoeboaphelidium protococcarum]|nr:hypothetical protein MP228_011756 [Amoeboaphelidium protococcarum]
MKVAFLGPRGTYSQQAALELFRDRQDVQLEEAQSIQDVFRLVLYGEVDQGVVPYYNSQIGDIEITKRLLEQFKNELVIGGSKVRIAINHCLLSQHKDATEITSVYSHPEAFKQCHRFLASHSEWNVVKCSSTAQAALKASETRNSAAICNKICLDIYPSLQLISEGIQDDGNNRTTFIIISKQIIGST